MMRYCERLYVVTLVICSVTWVARGYNIFQGLIPNGMSVSHPCISGETWQGVGHQAHTGGGPRNAFGADFLANGKVWNRTLCIQDSDRDGETNGQELGDPDCLWTPGNIPARTTDITHPGVCEPIDAPECVARNSFLNCNPFQCPAIDEPETFKQTVKLQPIAVPARETTYQCMAFNFPTDKSYHLVGYKPNIDNWNVMHHAIIYGCSDEGANNIPDFDINVSKDCFMGENAGCEQFMAIWALGMDGYCFFNGTGLPIGIGGYKRAVLELHWNNPGIVNSYVDGSGFDIFLTEILRPIEAGVLMIGQSRLLIPPHTPEYKVNGQCASRCTEQVMTSEVHVFSVFNHMHNLGSAAKTTVRYKDTSRVDYLGYDPVYEYDEPVMHNLREPMTIKPGDQLEIECVFNSTSRNRTTRWGLETKDEMCYAFLFYYPAGSLQGEEDCVSNGIFEECPDANGNQIHNGCDFGKEFDLGRPEVLERYSKVAEYCDLHVCLGECKAYIKQLYQEPCYNYENRLYVKEIYYGSEDSQLEVRDYWSRIQSCDWEIAQESVVIPTVIPGDTSGATSNVKVTGLLAACLLFVVFLLK